MSSSKKRILAVLLVLATLALLSVVALTAHGEANAQTEITILHTNDEHGWLQTFVAYNSPITEGGAANLMGRFREIEGYDPDDPDSTFLLLSAGDNWTGPSISTWFEGEPVVEVMNAMGYDVSVIGNHEFDFGRDALDQRIAEADFPFLSANIYYSGTTTLADFATPYIIKDVDGVKVGIVGLTTTSTPWTTHPKNISDLTFGDYEEALRREVPNARAEGADLIIVVGHVCSSELIPLAEAVSDLDIAVMQGGHCHDTVVDQVGDTLIIEAHWAWRAYGKTELFLNPTTYDVISSTHQVILNQYVTDEGNPVTPDPDVEAIVDYWQGETDEVMGEVIGYTETGLLRGSWKQVNYILDSWLWAYGTADFAISNWGGFRADIEAGDITVGDIVGVLPFENRIVDCAITGAQLVENLECCGGAIAGFTYTYHEVDGQTVVDSVTLGDGSPLDMEATYHVLVNDFMYAGGDGYLFGQQDPLAYDTGIQWRQPVIDWTKAQNTSTENPIESLIDDQPRVTQTYMLYFPKVARQAGLPTYLTILHNNDGESALLGDGDFGGVARFATVVDQVRTEVGDSHPLLLVTSGDNFLAGPEWTASMEKGVPFYDSIALDLIGYDAMCIGNHDFDFGPDTLADFIEGFTTSQVPFLSANLDFTAEPRLQALANAGRIAASVVVEVGGEQFGIVGATTPNLTFISSPRNVVVGQDVQAAVQAEIDALEAGGVNKIVLISHLQGIEEDMALAPLVSGVDVMIAGGGDEVLANPGDLLVPGDEIYGPYPLVVQNADGADVPVVTTAGEYKYLGHLEVGFDEAGTVTSFQGGPVRVAGGDEPDAVEADAEVQAQVVDPVAAFVAGLAENVIATSEVALDGRRNSVRSIETNEGNLIGDAFLWKAMQLYADYGAPAPDIAMSNGGGIRNNNVIPAGDITELDTFSMLPFPNFLTIVPDVTPDDFLALLENAVSALDAEGNPTGAGTGRFAQIGGFSFIFDPRLDPFGRVVEATLDDGTVMIENGEVAPTARNVNVAIVDFLARGGDEYFGGPPGRSEFFILGTSYQQALADYIQAPAAEGGLEGLISAAQYPEGGEGRITKLDKVITILHTNDTHGRWDATTYYGDPNGMVYLASHIAAERAKNPNLLLLDAGDTFQGNAFAQYFRNNTPNPIAGGLNLLDYDVMVIGNHEYNFGPTTFATMLSQVDCPILGTANTDDDGSYGFLNDNVQDYVNFDVDGLKVTVFGLTVPDIPVYELPTNIPGLTFYEVIPTSEVLVPQIRADEDPDLLVALTHLGYDVYKGDINCDTELAKAVPGIDVIVGGHSHTRLDPAVMVTSTANPEGTLIGQAYKYSQYLGKINIGFTGNMTDGYEIVLREGFLLPAKEVSPDADLTAYLQPFVDELAGYTEQEIGQTTVPIDALEAFTEETTGANLQCDASVWELAQHGIDVDFHLSGATTNAKVADDATPASPVTLTIDDMYTLIPYENSLVAMSMNGPQIKQILERAYRNYYYYKYVEGWGGYSHYTTCMLDISAGGVITYRDAYPELPDGDNVVSLVFNGTQVDFSDADTYYNVSTVNYVAAGSCNFNDEGVTLWPLDQITADTQYYVRDSVIGYIQANTPISPQVEGRLVFMVP